MSKRILLLYSIAVGIIIFILICYDIFYESDIYIDKHIRELKYEQGQMHQEENQQTQEKLYGCCNQKSKEEYR